MSAGFRYGGYGRGPMVEEMMMVVVVGKVEQKVVWNLIFEGFCMILFLLWCWFLVSYYFCTNSLRRILRARCFVVRAMLRWRTTSHDGSSLCDRVRPILVRFPRNLNSPWRSSSQSSWRNRRPQELLVSGALSIFVDKFERFCYRWILVEGFVWRGVWCT